MRLPTFLALLLALLVATVGADLDEGTIVASKCCDVHQMLSENGKLCVDVPWPRNISFQWRNGYIVPPLDNVWLWGWLAPGIPLQNVRFVNSKKSHGFLKQGAVSSVNESSLFEPALLQNADIFGKTIAFLHSYFVARPKPGGGYRQARYCVDAAPPPLGPFAMQLRTMCTDEECASKCCPGGKLLKGMGETWVCKEDAEGYWAPKVSSLTLDSEFPFAAIDNSKGLHLSTWAVKDSHQALHDRGIMQFHFVTWETCFDFYRSRDNSLHEGLFYRKFSRITRGVYWLLRPLSFLSALLLLASLVSVACDKSMRRKIHGRCLACHAACLLAFNIGQIGYYMTISDRVDDVIVFTVPQDLKIVCKYIALWMYFLLTAAWFWITALCLNMTMSFRFQVARPTKDSRKKFLALTALAWGLPVVLTITCSHLLAHETKNHDIRWYNPSLAESRVCYKEYIAGRDFPLEVAQPWAYFLKSGTALFYFGPVCCLVVCNVICLALTLRKVQYLKRGNSILRREEDQIPLGQKHTVENNPPMAHAVIGDEKSKRSGTNIDAKTIKLYIKMILMTGGVELLCEVIMWSTTVYKSRDKYSTKDLGLAYRAAGYVTDFFRAAVVTWLAAPEGGYLGLMRRLHRGKREKKSAGASDSGRRNTNLHTKSTLVTNPKLEGYSRTLSP